MITQKKTNLVMFIVLLLTKAISIFLTGIRSCTISTGIMPELDSKGREQ